MSPILRYFAYEHLRADLQPLSQRFHDLAHFLDANLPDGAEKSAGLRKLLEAKDCMVRAALDSTAASRPTPTPTLLASPPPLDDGLPAGFVAAGAWGGETLYFSAGMNGARRGYCIRQGSEWVFLAESGTELAVKAADLRVSLSLRR